MKKISLSIASALLVFSVMNPAYAFFAKGTKEIDQSNVCLADGLDNLGENCKEDDILIFTPTVYGNEQLPLIVVAVACNLNHQVLMNNSGVVCTFTSKRAEKLADY